MMALRWRLNQLASIKYRSDRSGVLKTLAKTVAALVPPALRMPGQIIVGLQGAGGI